MILWKLKSSKPIGVIFDLNIYKMAKPKNSSLESLGLFGALTQGWIRSNLEFINRKQLRNWKIEHKSFNFMLPTTTLQTKKNPNSIFLVREVCGERECRHFWNLKDLKFKLSPSPILLKEFRCIHCQFFNQHTNWLTTKLLSHELYEL